MKQAFQNRDLKVNLIGHSNAGLVSHYYIENLNGDKHVEKLITMNTPHWGSGIATISKNNPFRTGDVLETVPLHLDLTPSGMHFGGKQSSRYFDKEDKNKYMNSYQTEELQYNNHGQTEYYFIVAYDDFAPNLLRKKLRNRTFMFDVTPKSNTFSVFRDSIASGFFNQYPEYKSTVPFTFTDIGGDNVVNNQSQIGVTYKDFGNGKNINADGYAMLIDTIPWHNYMNHLHGQAPKRAESIRQVMYYLYE